MSLIENIHCSTWADFKVEFINILFGGGPFKRGIYWFRGQESALHRLESSFDRWYSQANPSSKRRAELSDELIAAFVEEACWTDEYVGVKDSPPKILGLARHFGLPTRQLDWSESPYVAAFFAFANCQLFGSGGGEVAIWALNCKSRVWGKEEGVELETVDRAGNARLKHQAGGFTVLRTPSADLEQHVGGFTAKPGESPALWKFTLPDSLAKEALADLDSMGISFAALYGGLSGAVLSAKMRVTLAMD